MAITIGNLSTYVAEGIAAWRARFPKRRHDTESFAGTTSRAVAMQVLGFAKAAEDADNDAVPGPKNSDAGADNWAYALGIPSNNPTARDGFGRHASIPAAGGQGTPTGVAGTNIPAGSTLVDPTGQVTLATTASATLNGPPNNIAVGIAAATAGPTGNLAQGTVVTWQPAIPNIDPTMTLTLGLSGGADIESTSALESRILFRTQNPPRGGDAADFRYWAEHWQIGTAVQTSVKRAYVYPLRGGVGTVHIVVTGYGSGIDRQILNFIGLAPVITLIGSYVNSVRPVCSQSTVFNPQAVNAGELRVRCLASQARYDFDWRDFNQPLTVASIVGATQVTVNANVATDPRYSTLYAAFMAGRQPRLQIQGVASVLPLERRVSGITNAANSVVTLIEGNANVTVNDLVWAGGPIVLPVAQQLLEYIDNLGPSKASGYADPTDSGDIIIVNGAKITRAWDDTIRLAEMERIALDILDPTDNRTRMVLDRSSSASIDGNLANTSVGDALANTAPGYFYVPSAGIIVTHS